MKNISDAMQAHLAGDTTLAELIKITRQDGAQKAFTNHDKDLFVDGVVYKADGSFSAEDVTLSAKMQSKGLAIYGILDSAALDPVDLSIGVYDHARIDVSICNWADLSMGIVPLYRGWLGEVRLMGTKYFAEMRGLQDLLQRKVGDVYSPECRFALGDVSCGLNVQTYSGTVTGVQDKAVFADTACNAKADYFMNGLLSWVSGANSGQCMEVKAWDAENKIFTLWLPMPKTIADGDSFVVTQGCDKRFATCCGVFKNGANFGGFPHLPGLAKVLEYPESS